MADTEHDFTLDQVPNRLWTATCTCGWSSPEHQVDALALIAWRNHIRSLRLTSTSGG